MGQLAARIIDNRVVLVVDAGGKAWYTLLVKFLMIPAAFVCCAVLDVAPLAQGGTLAQFRTAFGDIEVELFDQEKPETVANFIRYVRSGSYHNQISHGLMPGVMLLGGGFTVSNDTIYPVATFAPIKNEFGVGAPLSNLFGTLAMGKLPGNTNSATSQWFFNLGDNVEFDASDENNSFVVFGRVLRGTNVLGIFNNFELFNGLQASNVVADLSGVFGADFTNCPLRYPGITTSNYILVEVTLLEVGISVLPEGKEIAWNSAANVTNIVEFSASLPPIWNTLIRTNGTGSRMSYLDSSGASNRFYRVRVSY